MDGIALELVNPPDSLAFQRIAQESGISNRLIFPGISSLVSFVTAIIRKSLMIVNGCKVFYLNPWKTLPAKMVVEDSAVFLVCSHQ